MVTIYCLWHSWDFSFKYGHNSPKYLNVIFFGLALLNYFAAYCMKFSLQFSMIKHAGLLTIIYSRFVKKENLLAFNCLNIFNYRAVFVGLILKTLFDWVDDTHNIIIITGVLRTNSSSCVVYWGLPYYFSIAPVRIFYLGLTGIQ